MTRFATLTTAHLTDACLRLGHAVRCAPVRAVHPGDRLEGRALPVRHAGSVDVYLEAFERAEPGDVLVVDNAAREDEACLGDLVVLEARGAGLSGVLAWGLHRDTADITAIGLPVFSLGAFPSGPRRLDEVPSGPAVIAGHAVTSDDVVLADEDGALFVPGAALDELFTAAETIRDTERRQAELIRAGTSLRAQVRFTDYLAARRADPALTFRDHLRGVGGAIEV
ncbi:RraA family protein [Actinosynnema sp. NPDC020468]|uniref:RraA family protein n=1 Tax=Actinosynnema sp. NPDC020468 TaxID=3154488 RepID=UPI0033E4AB07